MLPAIVAIFLSFWLILIGVLAFTMAVALEIFLVVRLVATMTNWRAFVGSVITAVFVGPFAYMFGRGAWLMSSDAINGLIGRFG